MAFLSKLGSLQGRVKQVGSVGSANPASILATAAENKPGSAAGQLMDLGKLAYGFSGGMGGQSASQPGMPEPGAQSVNSYPDASLGVNTDLGYGQPQSLKMPEFGSFQRRMSRISLRGGQ